MPARLSKKYKEVLLIAKKAHNVLKCRGSQDLILNFSIIIFIY